MRFSPIFLLILFPSPFLADSPRLDPYGDPLPKGASVRIGTTRMLHENTLTWVEIARNGKRIVSGGMYGEKWIHVWDAGSGKRIALIPTKEDQETWRVAISPDGKRVAALLSNPGKNHYQMHLVVWDVDSKKRLCDVYTNLRQSNEEPIAFSPDGKLAAVQVGDIYLIDIEKAKVIRTFVNSNRQSTHLSFVKNGKYLFGGGPKYALWNIENGHKFVWDSGTLLETCQTSDLSEDGKVLLIAGFKEAYLADLTFPDKETDPIRLTQRATFPLEDVNAKRSAIAPDGKRFLLVGDSTTIHQFSSDPKKPVQKQVFQTMPITFRFVDQTPFTIERGKDMYSRELHLWDLEKGKERSSEWNLKYADSGASWSKDGKEIYTGNKRWDSATGKFLREEKPQPFVEKKPWQTPDGRTGLISKDGKTAIISIAEKQDPRAIFSSRLQVVPPATGVEVWDTQKNQVRTKFRDTIAMFPRMGSFHSPQVMLSEDARTFLFCNYTELQIWDVTTGRLLVLEDLAKSGVGHPPFVELTPDGRRVLLLSQSGAFIFDIASQTYLFRHQQKPKGGGWTGGTLLANLSRMAIGSDQGYFKILDTQTGQNILETDTEQKWVQRLIFSPDGKRILTQGSAGWGLIWDLPEQKNLSKGFDPKELDEAWKLLLEVDAHRVQVVMNRWFLSGKEEIDFLGKHLIPEANSDEKEVRKLLDQLTSDQFRQREAAKKKLLELGEPVVPYLRKQLEEAKDPDLKERLIQVVDKPIIRLKPLGPEELRKIRAVEICERIHSPEAQTLLKRLASGSLHFPLTEESQRVLERWER
jgi:WD40 repeat protein